MRSLTKVIVLAVLTLWVLALMHCKLEALPGFDFLASCCSAESAPPQNDCDEDGCGTVENGDYRVEDEGAGLPQPSLSSADVLFPERNLDLRARLLSRTQAAPELSRVWQFHCRTALPVRAPSAAS